MALGKNGMDLKAIRRDQKAIDALPNHGRAFAKSKALEKAKGGKFPKSESAWAKKERAETHKKLESGAYGKFGSKQFERNMRYSSSNKNP